MLEKFNEKTFGLLMCVFMAYGMSLFNFIMVNGFSKETLLLEFKIFPVVFVVAFLIQKIFVSNLQNLCNKYFFSKITNKRIQKICNIVFIVFLMSLLMTNICGIYHDQTLIRNITIWPRNLLVALIINIFIATPLSKLILNSLQKSSKINSKIFDFSTNSDIIK